MTRSSEPIVQGQESEGMNLTDNNGQPPNSRVNPDGLGTAARPVHSVQHVQPVQPEQPVQSIQPAQSGFRTVPQCPTNIYGCTCRGIPAFCKKTTHPTMHPILNRNSNA